MQIPLPFYQLLCSLT
uniref:Uncharacterized protein n=1 Tax=Arundo donax TaxID=35708 RepID=A0A0A9EXW2_ARUDO